MAEERLEEIRAARMAQRARLLAAGQTPYPAEVRRTHTVHELHDQFAALVEEKKPLTVAGRVMSVRHHGGVTFLDMRDESGQLQLQVSRDGIPADIYARIKEFDTGDFIEAAGHLTLTQRGVKTLLVTEAHILSKSIRPLPSTWFGLKDTELRFRQREVDFLLNDKAREGIRQRSRIIEWLRQYLIRQGFLEVETPILQPVAGGATATPFTTHHGSLDMSLYLRIAPELYLKRLLVGGFERVFEVGRNFRNEGIDRDHNPEFTGLEFYLAYADYEDLMDFTEKMLASLVSELFGSDTVSAGTHQISFAGPFQRLRYIDALNDVTGFDILEEKDPQTYETFLKEKGIELPNVVSYPKLVDELYKNLLRPKLLQPTLLFDYPTELVPLAKRNATDPRVAEKFQLVINGTELINAYTELNDPVEQRARFEEQMQARAAGDTEAQAIDEPYLRALEYGMPPAAGWGLGVDRLVALLTGVSHVRDTIAFPLLKPEDAND